MLDLGFGPMVKALVGQMRPDRQTLMFSATWETEVAALAAQHLYNPVKITLDKAEEHTANKDVLQKVSFKESDVEKKEECLAEIRKLKEAHPEVWGSRGFGGCKHV